MKRGPRPAAACGARRRAWCSRTCSPARPRHEVTGSNPGRSTFCLANPRRTWRSTCRWRRCGATPTCESQQGPVAVARGLPCLHSTAHTQLRGQRVVMRVTCGPCRCSARPGPDSSRWRPQLPRAPGASPAARARGHARAVGACHIHTAHSTPTRGQPTCLQRRVRARVRPPGLRTVTGRTEPRPCCGPLEPQAVSVTKHSTPLRKPLTGCLSGFTHRSAGWWPPGKPR